MSISVRIPPVLRTQTGGAKIVSVDGASLGAVLTALTAAHPDLRQAAEVGDRFAGQLRIGDQLVQATFQFADIAADGAGQKLNDIFTHLRLWHIGETLL